ncbi:MAG: hypothetical protein L0J73_05365 [Halomonas sp.]|nr:hypothetical protein [Halomonas sp.]
MKKTIRILCSSMVVLLVSACGQEDAADNASAESTYSLNVGIVMNEQDPMYKGAVQFKEAVEERTNGDVEVNVFSSSQLGSTADLLEQARVGANVATLTDAGPLGDMVREISILQAPYIVRGFG